MCHKLRNIPFDPEKNQQRILPGNWGEISNRNSFVQMCTTVTQCELSIYTFRNIIPPEKCKILCLKMYTFRVGSVCIGSANAIASGP